MSTPKQRATQPDRLLLLPLLWLLLMLSSACQSTPAAQTDVPAADTTELVPRPAGADLPTAPPPSATALPPTATPVLSPPTATIVPPTITPGPLPQIAVLAYHHFGVPAAGEYDCPLEKFEDQLRWLKTHHYESVLPQQLIGAAAGRSTLPAHPVMFTFDDNNGEQYTDAAPLLEQYGYRGAFFIMTVTIGKRYYMKADQLKDLERRGHTIGGHTWDHRNVAILTAEELATQLNRSENDLNEVLGHKPQFMSYPFGLYTPDVVADLQKRGYQGAFRLRDPDDPKVAPQFMIHRQVIPGTWSIDEFADTVHSMEP